MNNIDRIFAEAKCEVWKERVKSEECTLKEFNEALKENKKWK